MYLPHINYQVSRFKVQGCSTNYLNSRYQFHVPKSWLHVSRIQIPVPNFQFQVPMFRFQINVSGNSFQVQSLKFQIVVFHFPKSESSIFLPILAVQIHMNASARLRHNKINIEISHNPHIEI